MGDDSVPVQLCFPPSEAFEYIYPSIPHPPNSFQHFLCSCALTLSSSFCLALTSTLTLGLALSRKHRHSCQSSRLVCATAEHCSSVSAAFLTSPSGRPLFLEGTASKVRRRGKRQEGPKHKQGIESCHHHRPRSITLGPACRPRDTPMRRTSSTLGGASMGTLGRPSGSPLGTRNPQLPLLPSMG